MGQRRIAGDKGLRRDHRLAAELRKLRPGATPYPAPFVFRSRLTGGAADDVSALATNHQGETMTTGFFGNIAPIRYEGPQSDNPLAFRHYEAGRKVFGKTIAEHLRPAICYWHNFAWAGVDMFGAPTFDRPWFGETMQAAKLKADVAFEMFSLLGAPFFTFHDRDVVPEGDSLAEFGRNLAEMTDYFAGKMKASGVKLLWGTANLFSHPRYMAGAATNPDPDVFAFAAAQVKNVLDATHKLDGANYVLWGGREGYETLLNTDLKREQEQLGRFLSLVVDYKHKIGFKGVILVEPKPQEPTKHQYDYDVATVFGFLQKFGLEKEVKVNIEVGHAVLAGHSFEHEVAMARALGIFGSLDANRNDYQSGWDTDQFPNNAAELVPALYHILKGGGIAPGGLNFDAKLRRQSIDPEDLLIAHIGGLDTSAQALTAAAKLIEDGKYDAILAARYAGWDKPEAKAMLNGERALEEIAKRVADENISPKPRSGKQELIENLLNRYV